MKAPGALVTSEEARTAALGWTPRPERTATLIAAAGRGSRLGYHLPKVLYPVDGRPVLAWLADRLQGLVGRMTLVLSPEGERQFLATATALPIPHATLVQRAPTGMADAVLAASPHAADDGSETLVVLWGDQVGVSRETIVRALAVHATLALQPAITVPLAQVDAPYVHYEFDRGGDDGRLVAVRQRREGDPLPDAGLADCGCFVIAPRVVLPALKRLSASGLLTGRLSGEQNFLQALPFLAREMPLVGVAGASAADTIGLNSTADLERLSRAGGAPGRDRA